MENRRNTKKKSTEKATYFKNGEGKKNAQYKLWVVWKDEHAGKYPSNPFVYYSYNKLKENGQQALLKLAASKRMEFKLARIYNNISGEQILQITGETKNQTSHA